MSGKIFLLIDGLDEINISGHRKVIELIKVLRQTQIDTFFFNLASRSQCNRRASKRNKTICIPVREFQQGKPNQMFDRLAA